MCTLKRVYKTGSDEEFLFFNDKNLSFIDTSTHKNFYNRSFNDLKIHIPSPGSCFIS